MNTRRKFLKQGAGVALAFGIGAGAAYAASTDCSGGCAKTTSCSGTSTAGVYACTAAGDISNGGANTVGKCTYHPAGLFTSSYYSLDSCQDSSLP